jgi:hypothetical protein
MSCTTYLNTYITNTKIPKMPFLYGKLQKRQWIISKMF